MRFHEISTDGANHKLPTLHGLANKPLLSVDEVAILLGQSRSSIYRSIERRDLPLPIFKLNGRWRVPRRAVERLLDGDVVEIQSKGPVTALQSPGR